MGQKAAPACVAVVHYLAGYWMALMYLVKMYLVKAHKYLSRLFFLGHYTKNILVLIFELPLIMLGSPPPPPAKHLVRKHIHGKRWACLSAGFIHYV